MENSIRNKSICVPGLSRTAKGSRKPYSFQASVSDQAYQVPMHDQHCFSTKEAGIKAMVLCLLPLATIQGLVLAVIRFREFSEEALHVPNLHRPGRSNPMKLEG